MNLYGNLICAAIVLALAGAAYMQGRSDGAAHIKVEWDASNRAAADLADAERRKDQEKAKKLASVNEAKATLLIETNRRLNEKVMPQESCLRPAERLPELKDPQIDSFVRWVLNAVAQYNLLAERHKCLADFLR